MSNNVQVVYERCCGLDIHKRKIEACALIGEKMRRNSFGTTSEQLHKLADWLKKHEVEIVAMESTGVYWKPVINVLEAEGIKAIIVNAQHIKNVPGRKTDVKDAEWIASLLRHGLLKPSFIPERRQREMREITRLRTAKIQERAREIQRLQKFLEGCNIKLSSVVSDINGVTAKEIIKAIAAGVNDPKKLAELSRGRLSASQEELETALDGIVSPDIRTLIQIQLEAIEALDKQIASLDLMMERIEQEDENFKEALELIDTIPGIGKRIAQVILAEIGLDMSRFPSDKHIAAWSGLAPGNNESAGKRRSGKAKPGNPQLRSQLVQAAHTIARMKNCYLSSLYHRIAARRGKKRAAVAVAHAIIVIIYHMLIRKEPYKDLGENYLSEQMRRSKIKNLVNLVKNIKKLDDDVQFIISDQSIRIVIGEEVKEFSMTG
ncbi:transposase IS116/IS110/IS902 family protein [Thermosinus carboxydivorans Nor1]|uniref:Transposase IS116/IS110/IS902 family protein n=1 Tax=Thermosinus carboxydivorans Nor1 TaxID=401526 RepID=A1HT42_9FIRM|nr:IS110 family transposase [Thermosinus carboxydivorans]EAX46806.1 transposase IS116/IS110/IS902 family protein [Thermosinus carboxydivorans Nor1]